MAEKKSFFQILTGSDKTEEAQEDNETSGEEQEIHLQEEATETPYEGAVETEEQETEPEEEEKGKEESEEEEAEGQLTLDVYQNDMEIVIKTPVAGVKQEDLDVEISSDLVKIRGKRKQEETIAQDNYFHQELYWGNFSRSVILPAEIDEEQAEATLANGILTIRLPKLKKDEAKKLKIKAQ